MIEIEMLYTFEFSKEQKKIVSIFVPKKNICKGCVPLTT